MFKLVHDFVTFVAGVKELCGGPEGFKVAVESVKEIKSGFWTFVDEGIFQEVLAKADPSIQQAIDSWLQSLKNTSDAHLIEKFRTALLKVRDSGNDVDNKIKVLKRFADMTDHNARTNAFKAGIANPGWMLSLQSFGTWSWNALDDLLGDFSDLQKAMETDQTVIESTVTQRQARGYNFFSLTRW